jgi:hypothetical protein
MPNVSSITDAAPPCFAPLKHQWRFVDAAAFIYHGAVRLVKVDNIPQQEYIAISYNWTQDIIDWRECLMSIGEGENYEEKIANGSLLASVSAQSDSLADHFLVRAHLFITAVSLLTYMRGKKLFWIDILCTNQDDIQEKEYFVPKMGSLYRKAHETLAFLTGSSIATSISSDAFYNPIWETRAWTLQEHILSKDVLFCYLIDGDAIRDIECVEDQSSGCQTINLRSLTTDGYKVFSFRAGYAVVFGNGRKVTCYTEKESWSGGLPLSSFLHTEVEGKGNWGGLEKYTGRGTLYKTVYKLRHNPSSSEETISATMMMLGGRTSTWPQDMIYSVLGILRMEDYRVDYGVSFEEARMRVFEAMGEDILALTLGTDWGCNSNTGNKDTALPRLLASEPTVGIDSLRSTALAKYNRRFGTEIKSRTERFRIWKDIRKRQSRSLGVVRTMLGSMTARLMIMYCVSLFDDPSYSDIPTSEIPEEKIHVIIVDGSRISDEEYSNDGFDYDKITNFVEVGRCEHHALFSDAEDHVLRSNTAVLALECEDTASGQLTNKGTVLILNASALSGQSVVNVVV